MKTKKQYNVLTILSIANKDQFVIHATKLKLCHHHSTNNSSTGLNLPSQYSPLHPTDVLRLSSLSDTSISKIHKEPTTLFYNFDKESTMENFNSVSKEQCLKQISLHFAHLDSGTDNIYFR